MSDVFFDTSSLLINMETFDTDTIVLSKPASFKKNPRAVSIFYKAEETDGDDQTKTVKKRIRLMTPKMSVPFGPKDFENKENDRISHMMSMSFGLLPDIGNDDELRESYKFFRKIDKALEDCIKASKKVLGLPEKIAFRHSVQRLTDDFPCHLNVALPHDGKEFMFKVYDESASESSIKIVEKKSVVSVVLELTEIWFGKEKFGINWNVLQIRKFKPYSPIREFFLNKCVIMDTDDPDDEALKKLVSKYKEDLEKKFPALMAPYLDKAYEQVCNMNRLTHMNQMVQLNQLHQLNQVAQMKHLNQLSQLSPDQLMQLSPLMSQFNPFGHQSPSFNQAPMRIHRPLSIEHNQRQDDVPLLIEPEPVSLGGGFCPSASELKDRLKGLRKTKTDDRSGYPKDVDGSDSTERPAPMLRGKPPPPPPLPGSKKVGGEEPVKKPKSKKEPVEEPEEVVKKPRSKKKPIEEPSEPIKKTKRKVIEEPEETEEPIKKPKSKRDVSEETEEPIKKPKSKRDVSEEPEEPIKKPKSKRDVSEEPEEPIKKTKTKKEPIEEEPEPVKKPKSKRDVSEEEPEPVKKPKTKREVSEEFREEVVSYKKKAAKSSR